MTRNEYILNYYYDKAKKLCAPEIKHYGALQLAVFKARRNGGDLNKLTNELKIAYNVAFDAVRRCLSVEEHLKIADALDDKGKIKTLPDFFKNCII
ncbi:MAG: hypothetical protein ACTTJC_01985 [Campylobacter sp.]